LLEKFYKEGENLGMKKGCGVLRNKKGDTYDGCWENGLLNGKGILKSKEFNYKAEGTWVNGMQNG